MTSSASPWGARLRWMMWFAAFSLLGLWIYSINTAAPPPEEPFQPERFQSPQQPLTNFPVRPLAEVKDQLEPGELVIGLSLQGQARAYPINRIGVSPARKVINDTLGDRPIAVTWCDECHNAIVYSREVAGTTVTLAASGQLWKQSMVLYDLQTRSLWSHFQGMAKSGPLQGNYLRVLPSLFTDWATWSKRYPESTVAWLDAKSKDFTTELYASPDRYVVGLSSGRRAKVWTFPDLLRQKAINDTWQEEPIVVILEVKGMTAQVFAREVGGRTLTFQLRDADLTDRETGTIWEPVTGVGLEGPLAGKQLRVVPSLVSLRSAWLRFHPYSM